MADRGVKLFLSCVSGEFGVYRDALRHALTLPNVEVKIQEDFKARGGSDYRDNVGRLLILTRGESKNRIVSLSGFLFRPPLRLHSARSRRHAQNNSKRNEGPKTSTCPQRTMCPV